MLTERFWQAQALLENYIERADKLTPNTHQQTLKKLYGQEIYLCHYPACENSSVPKAFASISERQTHEDKHSRPFPCNQPTCSYSVIGFTTKKALSWHSSQYHSSSDDNSVNLGSIADFLFNDRETNQGRELERERDNTPASRSAQNRTKPETLLTLRSEVAYRPPEQKGGNQEGELIQCIIIDITGEGEKRRYTIQDPEPEETGIHIIYKAGANSLIPIPKDSIGLPPYPVGKQVLAMYPGTTIFYRAEVMGTKRDGTCRLKFEEEEEVGKETEVERRLVLGVGRLLLDVGRL